MSVDNVVGSRGKRTLSGARVKEFPVPPKIYTHDINLCSHALTSFLPGVSLCGGSDCGRRVTAVDEPQIAGDFKCAAEPLNHRAFFPVYNRSHVRIFERRRHPARALGRRAEPARPRSHGAASAALVGGRRNLQFQALRLRPLLLHAEGRDRAGRLRHVPPESDAARLAARQRHAGGSAGVREPLRSARQVPAERRSDAARGSGRAVRSIREAQGEARARRSIRRRRASGRCRAFRACSAS